MENLKMEKHDSLKNYLIRELINYLNKYLKKNFDMKMIFIQTKKSLNIDKSISINQFESLIKFIERERPFVTYTRPKIYEYFSPIINEKNKKKVGGTLEEFLI